MGKRAPVLAGVWLALSWHVGVSARASQGAPDPSAPSSHLRAADPVSAALVAEGIRRSETLRQLSVEIEVSDVMAYIVLSPEPGPWRGATRFVSASQGMRMLVVTISLALDSDERLAVLGHELQHVREVAAASDVVDVAGMRRLFVRVGEQLSPTEDRYETRAAQAVERRIRAEVARNR